MRLAWLAPFLLLVAAPAQAQDPTGPVSDALIDQFLAALPHPEEWRASREADPAELARLTALNPGREEKIRALLADHARCVAPAMETGTRRVLRETARGLGTEKLRQLIAFYASDDFRRMDAIQTRKDKGEPVSAAEDRQLAALLESRPVLTEFARAIQGSGNLLTQDEAFMSALRACAATHHSALEKAKLTAAR